MWTCVSFSMTLPLMFETGFLTEPRACRISWTGWPMSSRDHLSLPSSPRITKCQFSCVYFLHSRYLMIFIAFFFQKSFSINPVIYAVWGAIVIGSFDRFFSWLLATFMTLCMLSTFERTIWIWLFIFNYAEFALATLKVRGLWANLVFWFFIFLRHVSVYSDSHLGCPLLPS